MFEKWNNYLPSCQDADTVVAEQSGQPGAFVGRMVVEYLHTPLDGATHSAHAWSYEGPFLKHIGKNEINIALHTTFARDA